MSYGIVICSSCLRELHQDGDRAVGNGWLHCEDKTPICVGGTADYPKSETEIRGAWCGRDRGPVDENPRVRRRANGSSAAAALAAFIAASFYVPASRSEHPLRRRHLPKVRSNKYALCRCGSMKLVADCCGNGA